MASRGQEVGIDLDVSQTRPSHGPDAPELPRLGPERSDDQNVVIDLRGREPIVILEPVEAVSTDTQSGLFNPPVWKLAIKRAMDIFLGGVTLILLLPLISIAALAVATTSRGGVFFRQTRIGKNGEPFSFVKFRTMVDDADHHKGDLDEQNEANGPIFKIRQDPRITGVGRVMRKLSIDEIPQLLHVISGKMSLVGVRPPLPDEVDQYGEREWLRLAARPGLTCIWQTSGRSDLDFDTWIDMDLEYLENWSLTLDVKLLLKTIPAVLSGRGAY